MIRARKSGKKSASLRPPVPREKPFFNLALALLLGLVGAAVLHIVIILALPHFTGKDAYARITREGSAHRFHTLGLTADAAGLAQNDPFLHTAVCAFDVSLNPVQLTAQGDVTFWSVGVFDAAANEVYSMNDATAVEGRLDVILGTAAQIAGLRASQPELAGQTVLMEMPQARGYAVLRALAPQQSQLPAVQAFLAEAGCSPIAN
ncbi:DUF1254 domain-containing protein [Allorhizobium undicola]|uniref:DUF1254 domain-containing protein n=1 Tax=Allorhizobium undicola TaxID=78527 RepID=UPI000AA4BA29|nr:DUF1254 domain-containing protein [Allorhizobium undicola]